MHALVGLALADFIHRPVRAFAVRTALISQGEIDPDAPLPKTYKELERANAALTLIIGESRRLQSNPSLARSIEHRFPYLDPLNHLQVELMRRHRKPGVDPSKDRLRRGIHISINGIAAGLRNTG